jgi:hypothetical protein
MNGERRCSSAVGIKRPSGDRARDPARPVRDSSSRSPVRSCACRVCPRADGQSFRSYGGRRGDFRARLAGSCDSSIRSRKSGSVTVPQPSTWSWNSRMSKRSPSRAFASSRSRRISRLPIMYDGACPGAIHLASHFIGRERALLGEEFDRVVVAHAARMDTCIEHHASGAKLCAREVAEAIDVAGLAATNSLRAVPLAAARFRCRCNVESREPVAAPVRATVRC